MSRASSDFLTRQRVFEPNVQHMPKLARCGLQSHQRPFKPARGLVGPDTVVNRVRTQKEEDRPALRCNNTLPPDTGNAC